MVDHRIAKKKKIPVLIDSYETQFNPDGFIFGRQCVPGGWLYNASNGAVFVRDSSIRVCNTQDEFNLWLDDYRKDDMK